MPPEYVKGIAAIEANDIYSMALSLGEIFGLDKKLLVKARMNRALATITEEKFKLVIAANFEKKSTLDEALFSAEVSQYHDMPVFEEFIKNYVADQYDFEQFGSQLGRRLIDLLNAMQSKEPENRPSAQECLEQLRQVMPEITEAEINQSEQGPAAPGM